MATLIDLILQKYDLDNQVRLVPIQCTAIDPLQVKVDGSPLSIPARQLAGSAFAVGEYGTAVWGPPSPPICFKTTI